MTSPSEIAMKDRQRKGRKCLESEGKEAMGIDKKFNAAEMCFRARSLAEEWELNTNSGV